MNKYQKALNSISSTHMRPHERTYAQEVLQELIDIHMEIEASKFICAGSIKSIEHMMEQEYIKCDIDGRIYSRVEFQQWDISETIQKVKDNKLYYVRRK